jgi:hypothetical protein
MGGTKEPVPHSTIVLQILTVTDQESHFMEPEGLLQSPQEPATSHYTLI